MKLMKKMRPYQSRKGKNNDCITGIDRYITTPLGFL